METNTSTGQTRTRWRTYDFYNLEKDPYELANLLSQPAYRDERETPRRELSRLATEALVCR
jgi:hypothetical protein